MTGSVPSPSPDPLTYIAHLHLYENSLILTARTEPFDVDGEQKYATSVDHAHLLYLKTFQGEREWVIGHLIRTVEYQLSQFTGRPVVCHETIVDAEVLPLL